MSGKALSNMDAYLSDNGLMRKAITKDDTCLFRGVSEKLFYTQCHFKHVKSRCLDYLACHMKEYQPFVDEALEERLRHVREHKGKPGHLEMIIMSHMYRLDFVLFHTPSLQIFNLTQNHFYNKILLCCVEDEHYDLVYTKTHIENTALCQAIVYEVLYKGVFGLDSELEEAVMFLELQKQLPKDNCFSDCFLTNVIALFGRDKVNTLQKLRGRSSPPVPYRIAKALHPALYRNVELDIVQEEKREARLQSLGVSRGFSVGDKCQVVLEEKEDHPYNAHIQTISEQDGTVVVFVEELGVKKPVPASSIRPLPLQVPKFGEPETLLPVAELDVLRYLKKGRRKKNQSVIPPGLDGGSVAVTSSYRGRSSSSCSSINISGSDGNTSINSSIGSNSCSGGSATLSNNNFNNNNTNSLKNVNRNINANVVTRNNSGNNNVSSSGGSTRVVTTVVTGPAPSYTYAHPSQAYPVPYISPGDGSCSPGTIVDLPVVPKFGTVPVNYTSQPGEPGQYLTPVDPAQPYCIMSAGPAPAPGQGPMYWMPVVAVPYAANMGQVNLGWSPSQDPYGKDLPLSDMNTLRFFFNLGVEYYRMSSSAQPSSSYSSAVMYSTPGNPEVAPAGAVMVDGCGNYTSLGPAVCTDMHVESNPSAAGTRDVHMTNVGIGSGGANIVSKTESTRGINQTVKKTHDSVVIQKGNTVNLFKTDSYGKSDTNSSDSNLDTSSHSSNGKAQFVDKDSDNGDSKTLEKDMDDNVSEGMDAGSDGDSGCSSECADLSPVGGPETVFPPSETAQSEGGDSAVTEGNSPTESTKPRGKRRYYLYGNHKLIKPIKEIPLRFQILLAETSAARARCEGQPIYMQHQPQPQQAVYDIVYYSTNQDGTQQPLNANATTFVPSQQEGSAEASVTPTYMPECYSVCPVSAYSGSVPSNMSHQANTNTSLQPAPLFVPPMPPPGSAPSQTAPTQNCQTIIVYSTHSAHSSTAPSPTAPSPQQVRTVSMPPPFPPPPNLPPPHVDQIPASSTPCHSPAASQVVRAVTSNHPTISYTDHHMKNHNLQSVQMAPTNKPPVVINIPPPNRNPSLQVQPAPVSSSSAPGSASSVAPPPNHCMLSNYNNHTYLSVPQPLAPPSNLQAPMVNGHSMQGPPTGPQAPSISPATAGASPSVPYPGGSSNQYMYVYPSPPAGQSATPSHVVYMVSPALPQAQTYQQQGVLVPPTCPVPVQ